MPDDDLAEWHEDRRQRTMARVDREIPTRYRTAMATHPAVLAWAQSIRNADTSGRSPVVGPSLLLMGTVGVGKTYQAYGAVRWLAAGGATVIWAHGSASDIYATLRPHADSDYEQVFQRYARAGILLVDDLGAAKQSEWVEEQTFRLINHRYINQLPMLITSNVPPDDLALQLGERTVSRLVEMCSAVVLDGDDRRRSA